MGVTGCQYTKNSQFFLQVANYVFIPVCSLVKYSQSLQNQCFVIEIIVYVKSSGWVPYVNDVDVRSHAW